MASNTFDCGTNYLQPNGFRVVINRRNFPNLQFYAQSVSHPDVNLPSAEIAFSRISSVPYLGDATEYGTLVLEVLLDEDMNSYRELYNWMQTATDTKHHLGSNVLSTANEAIKDPSYYDITVAVLSSHNNVNRKFKYLNAFPTSIGQIQMNATTSEQFLSFQTTFRFDFFEFS